MKTFLTIGLLAALAGCGLKPTDQSKTQDYQALVLGIRAAQNALTAWVAKENETCKAQGTKHLQIDGDGLIACVEDPKAAVVAPAVPGGGKK